MSTEKELPVDRYTFECDENINKSKYGMFVKYDVYIELKKENERLLGELQQIKSGEYCRYLDDGICPEITKAERRGYKLAEKYKEGCIAEWEIRLKECRKDYCETCSYHKHRKYDEAKKAEAADASM